MKLTETQVKEKISEVLRNLTINKIARILNRWFRYPQPTLLIWLACIATINLPWISYIFLAYVVIAVIVGLISYLVEFEQERKERRKKFEETLKRLKDIGQ